MMASKGCFYRASKAQLPVLLGLAYYAAFRKLVTESRNPSKGPAVTVSARLVIQHSSGSRFTRRQRGKAKAGL